MNKWCHTVVVRAPHTRRLGPASLPVRKVKENWGSRRRCVSSPVHSGLDGGGVSLKKKHVLKPPQKIFDIRLGPFFVVVGCYSGVRGTGIQVHVIKVRETKKNILGPPFIVVGSYDCGIRIEEKKKGARTLGP